MQRRILLIALLATFFIAPLSEALGQHPDTTHPGPPYRLEVYVSGGPQISWFRERRTPFSLETGAGGTNLMGRVMWHPDHLLSVGLLSGWTSFSTEQLNVSNVEGEPRTLEAHLTAIPMQIAFGMQKWGVEIGVGIGAYWLFSDIGRENGVRATSSQIESGVSAQLAYTLMITDRFGIGPEVNVHALSYRGIVSASGQLRLRYDLLTY